MSPHTWSLFGFGSCVHCAEDGLAPGRGISPPFPWKIPYSCEECCHSSHILVRSVVVRRRPRLVANHPDKGPESRFCDLLKRLWENWPLGEMIEDLWSNPSEFSFKFELKKAKQQKGLKCTTEMPGGPPLLNPRLLLVGCIIAGKGFFCLVFLLLPVSAQEVSKLSSPIWRSLRRLCQRVAEVMVVTSPGPSEPYFSMTPTHSTRRLDGNCSRDKLMLGAAAGLLSGLSRQKHDTAKLEVAPAAGSLCRGVASDIPISKRTETSLFFSPGPSFSPDEAVWGALLLCSLRTEDKPVTAWLKAFGTRL